MPRAGGGGEGPRVPRSIHPVPGSGLAPGEGHVGVGPGRGPGAGVKGSGRVGDRGSGELSRCRLGGVLPLERPGEGPRGPRAGGELARGSGSGGILSRDAGACRVPPGY